MLLLVPAKPFSYVQSEVILRCGLSPYQSALYGLVKAALRAERDKAKGADKGAASRGVKGVNNTIMELRNICNHPMLRWVNQVHAQRESSSLPCVQGPVRCGCGCRIGCGSCSAWRAQQ